MGKSVSIRPLRRLTQAELDQFLEKAADILRGNVDHSEFRSFVFALLFYKRISDMYQEEVAKFENELGDRDLARNPKMHNFVVPEDFLWDTTARTASGQLGNALNEAMIGIERANQPKFDGILTREVDFNQQDKLPRAKLVSLINHFSTQNMNRAHVPDDLFGNAYEYLIRNFASKAGKSSGEFYTPKEVAFLMSEIVEPAPGHTICDWASGSCGLLLQCREYVKKHGGDPERLFLYAQESNVATYNISRINMILHGVRSWYHKQGDSLRHPQHLDDGKKLMHFDRILMNPPFSLENWGYDDFTGGDPFGRFGFGMPPRNNGDFAWLEHVVKSLKDDGKAIIVMSQGVLFRGQPEQTEEGDGQNQRADAEYIIREGFVKADLIECIIVLPSKLFYGNNVPGCLIILNKTKPPERREKMLMIWASRHFEKNNPQNLLRPSDLMRVLVPWRAFGDLPTARKLVGEHEKRLIEEEEADRSRKLKDIEDAYAPVLEPLPAARAELAKLDGGDWQALGFARKAEHSAKVRELKRTAKELEKVQEERDAAEIDVNARADREVAHLKEAAADLLRICSDAEEAKRFFAIVERGEIEKNEFNLNLPRYVDTFEPEEQVPLEEAVAALRAAADRHREAEDRLSELLATINGGM